jgi:hypothetical protein
MSSASPRGSCRFDTVAWPHCTALHRSIRSNPQSCAHL